MKIIFSVFLLLSFAAVQAQNDRVYDRNFIVWSQVFTTVRLGEKTVWLAEYQWRRTEGLQDWQQSLLRTAVQFRASDKLSFALGYGWIETFPYGDFPLAANGTFPEHRIFEQVQWKTTAAKWQLTQRFRIEQRWIGSRTAVSEREIDAWRFSHRFRHFAKLQHPVHSSGLYAAMADEIFIGAGKNVGSNLFDQNRIMLLLGKKISDKVLIECGYINQTVMQGKRVEQQTIMQSNNGLLLSSFINF
ncbi:MAG: DUF2490 domain-containing protein [Flavisolibacter sp.]